MAETRIELTDPNAYIAGLMAKLGNRNPFDVLAETPGVIQKMVETNPADLFSRRPFEGKWTPCEIIGHLLDVDFVFGYRIRTILCDDAPQVVGMDQDKWAARLGHNQRRPADLARDLASMRAINVPFYRSIPPEAYSRIGRHSERGEERLGNMLHYIAGHDLSHIDQLQRYLAAAKAMG